MVRLHPSFMSIFHRFPSKISKICFCLCYLSSSGYIFEESWSSESSTKGWWCLFVLAQAAACFACARIFSQFLRVGDPQYLALYPALRFGNLHQDARSFSSSKNTRDLQASHTYLVHSYIFYFPVFKHRIIRTKSFIGMATKVVSTWRCQLSMGPQARARNVQPTHCSLKRHALSSAAAAAAAIHGNTAHPAKPGWPHYAYATHGQ